MKFLSPFFDEALLVVLSPVYIIWLSSECILLKCSSYRCLWRLYLLGVFSTCWSMCFLKLSWRHYVIFNESVFFLFDKFLKKSTAALIFYLASFYFAIKYWLPANLSILISLVLICLALLSFSSIFFLLSCNSFTISLFVITCELAAILGYS